LKICMSDNIYMYIAGYYNDTEPNSNFLHFYT